MPAKTPSIGRSPRCFIQNAIPAAQRQSSSNDCTVTPRAAFNGSVSHVSGLKSCTWMSPSSG